MKVLVRVTEEDIKRGQRGSTTDDAMALAVRRALREQSLCADELSVNGDGVYLYTGTALQGLLAKLPWAECEWIADYDEGRPVQPLTFELELEGGELEGWTSEPGDGDGRHRGRRVRGGSTSNVGLGTDLLRSVLIWVAPRTAPE